MPADPGDFRCHISPVTFQPIRTCGPCTTFQTPIAQHLHSTWSLSTKTPGLCNAARSRTFRPTDWSLGLFAGYRGTHGSINHLHHHQSPAQYICLARKISTSTSRLPSTLLTTRSSQVLVPKAPGLSSPARRTASAKNMPSNSHVKAST